MLDDLLQLVIEGWAGSRDASPRTQRIVRLVFGLFGAGLAIAGMVVLGRRWAGGNPGMLLGMLGIFGAVAWFCLGTVILRRSPRLAGWTLGGSFALLFLSRVLFGP